MREIEGNKEGYNSCLKPTSREQRKRKGNKEGFGSKRAKKIVQSGRERERVIMEGIIVA